MKKILSVNNNRNNKTKFITRYLNAGFKANGCFVYQCEKNDILNYIKQYSPYLIFSYGDLEIFENEIVYEYLSEHKNEYKTAIYDENANFFDDKLKAINPYVFLTERENTKSFNFLPYGINSRVYKGIEAQGFCYDISFMGVPDAHFDIFLPLLMSFPSHLNVFCDEAKFSESVERIKQKNLLDANGLSLYKKLYRGFLIDERDIAKVCSLSKINLDLSETSTLNYRTLEIIISKGLAITKETPFVKSVFDVSREIETYKDAYELIDKVKFYLKKPNIAKKIGYNGYLAALKKHSSTTRAEMIMKTVKK